MLAQLKLDLGWLREQVLSAVRRGDVRASIQQANLIPPDLLYGNPDVVVRKNLFGIMPQSFRADIRDVARLVLTSS
jgi:hypothetical protein